MKCLNCGSVYVSTQGDLNLNDRIIGRFAVKNVSFMECKSCNGRLFSPETAEHIESTRKKILDDTLKSRPIKDYWTAAETANFLETTRQALNKHRRIRRGFIFQTEIGGKKVFLKESVERFKKEGDGRFPLRKSESTYTQPEKLENLKSGGTFSNKPGNFGPAPFYENYWAEIKNAKIQLDSINNGFIKPASTTPPSRIPKSTRHNSTNRPDDVEEHWLSPHKTSARKVN